MVFLLMIPLANLLVLAGLYLLSLRGRRPSPLMKKLAKSVYAHRGLHGNGLPENSLGAFRAALEHGYGIELDVHLAKDGSLPVFHDSTLNRVTGLEGKLCDLNAEQWERIPLAGTQETIPHFGQVLELFAGRQPMIIELKPDGNNQEALCARVCEALEGYEGDYCLESFDPRCIRWLRKHRPDLLRGQLSENFFRTQNTLPGILRFCMTFLLSNAFTRPDFVAYCFEDRVHPSVRLCRRLWGVTGVSWTIRSREDFDTALAEGWIPIFENFLP